VFALLGDQTLRMLPRGVDEYLERRRALAEAATPPPPPVKEKPAGDTRAAKKELQRIERQLDKLNDREEKLHAGIAEQSTDFEKVAELDLQLRSLRAEREELEMRWLELAENT